MTETQEATYISMQAAPGQENKLADFLTAGAQMVKETEPDTLLWSALQLDDTSFGIFDTFPNSAGRDTHFAGKVAAALNENASNLVDGGWEEGVVSNINNPTVLTAKVAKVLPKKIEKAVFIPITARPGKEKELADFLIAGGELVEQTEPETLYWFALKFDKNKFGIFDFFADQSGIDTHFAGKVAAALNENASELVEGGWEQGVLNGIKQFDVLAVIAQ